MRRSWSSIRLRSGSKRLIWRAKKSAMSCPSMPAIVGFTERSSSVTSSPEAVLWLFSFRFAVLFLLGSSSLFCLFLLVSDSSAEFEADGSCDISGNCFMIATGRFFSERVWSFTNHVRLQDGLLRRTITSLPPHQLFLTFSTFKLFIISLRLPPILLERLYTLIPH